MDANRQVNRATLKGHGFGLNTEFRYLGRDENPTQGADVVKATREGTVTVLTVSRGRHAGTEVARIGSAAKFWAASADGHAVTVTAKAMNNGDTAYFAECEHGYATGFHASADDAKAVVLGHDKVSRPLYVSPADEVKLWQAGDRAVMGGQDVKVLGCAMVGGAWEYEVRDLDGGAHSPRSYVAGSALVEWVPDLGVEHATDAHVTPTNTPAIDGYEWKRHVNPGESVWAGSTYQLIVAGSVCQVVATVTHRGNGLWAAQTCYWGNAGLTKDFWGGESLADAFANVVAHQDFLSRTRAAGLSAADVARIMDWRTWQATVVALPVRTPGETLSAWDMAEAAIWAGTDQVVRMRFPRKMKKAMRSPLGARRRPVDVKRARIAGGW